VTELKVAVAGVPGAWSSERMADGLRDAGVDSFVFSIGDCLHDLNSGEVWLDGRELGDLDGIIVKKLAGQDDPAARLRLHLLRALEDRGVRVFSATAVIDQVMDRYAMNQKLVGAGLPLPHTFSIESTAALRRAMSQLGSAVVKPVYTSKGRGMFRLDASDDLDDDEIDLAEGQGRMLVQRFVEAPGRDIGACVLGGEYVGSFYRVAKEGQWMTTTAVGGRYAHCDLSAKGIEIALAAARLFGLDYTVVDLVETGDEGFSLYEVSAFGGFTGLWRSAELDVASLYARYIKDSLTAAGPSR
jgi:ribosomal protein S6--L-glutamate ligase